MLGSSQRTGDHHQFHQHYYHQQLNHFAQPIFFHHQQQQLLKQEAFDEFGSATSSSFQVQAAAAAAAAGDQEAAAAYGSNRRSIEPTSVLDLWSPSPSSRGGCSKSASPPRSSAFVEESNSSEKSVEVSKFLNDHHQQQQQQVWGVVEDRDGEKPNRDKSLDEWLADLQQQKLVRRDQEEEEEDEEEEQHPASSSSCNKINDVHQHHPQQYGIEELESMLLSPSSSSAQACSSSLNHQLAKWLMSEDLGQQQQQQQASVVSSFGLVPKEDHEGFGDGGFYSASSSEIHGAPKIIQPFGGHFLRQQQQQPQAYPAHQPSSGVGLEQFFATTPSPGFGEAFYQQSTTTTPSFGHGGFEGIEEAVGWKRGRSPGILHQGDPFAEVHEENKKRMMMIQQQQQQQQLMNPLLLQFSNAFAVPLVAEAKPWGGSGAGHSSKLQRVHSNSELVGGDGIGISSSSCNRVIPSGFSTISTGLSPVSLNSSSSRNPSPNPTTATATTTALPSTISVPDEGGLGLMDQLLQLAQAIDVGGTQVAQSILARLNQHLFCHQQGKRIHRLAFYFKEALAARLNSSSSSPNPDHPPHQQQTAAAAASNSGSSAAQLFNKIRAYTSFCEISPLLRFSYLTANQAILESIQGEAAAHIVDFDPRFGSQWASLLQDMAAPHNKSNNYGASGQAQPVQFPRLRFTMVGPDLGRLSFVVESLREFATSLHLLDPPQFNLLLCDQPGSLTPSMLGVADGEPLVFNFMFSLHRSLALPDGADAAVSAVMTASPRLVTVAEQEVDDCDGKFQRRFVETLQYYAFVLDSLGPDDGAGTLTVEREILSPDIANAVSEEGWGRTERHERLSTWKARMARGGFESVAASDVAKLQGECLIRRHLHGKNFEVVRDDDGAMLLGWQGKNLVAVSAWTPADSSSKNNIC